MLQVFSDDESREEIHSQLKLIEGYNCYPSGLTPPTKNIIKRKFLKTRLHKERPVNVRFFKRSERYTDPL